MSELEVFKVNNVTKDNIDLSSQNQLRTLLACIANEEDVLVEWADGGKKKSQIILTEGLHAQLKDGSFTITATEAFKKGG